MAGDFLSVDTSANEFNAFCNFLVGIQKRGTESLTPEQSVQEFRNHQAQLRQWEEKNFLSQQQSQRGEAKPLDDKAVLARLRTKLAQEEAIIVHRIVDASRDLPKVF